MPWQSNAGCVMNGERYLLDTNAIVALLRGESNTVYLPQSADRIGISVISQIEFLAFTGLSEADRSLFAQLLQRIHVVGLSGNDNELIERIVRLRQECRLKLPDAIIAASALTIRATLLTADRHFYSVPKLQVIPC